MCPLQMPGEGDGKQEGAREPGGMQPTLDTAGRPSVLCACIAVSVRCVTTSPTTTPLTPLAQPVVHPQGPQHEEDQSCAPSPSAQQGHPHNGGMGPRRPVGHTPCAVGTKGRASGSPLVWPQGTPLPSTQPPSHRRGPPPAPAPWLPWASQSSRVSVPSVPPLLWEAPGQPFGNPFLGH